MAMEKESHKSKKTKAKDESGESVFRTVEDERKSKKKKKARKDERGQPIVNANQVCEGDAMAEARGEADEERKSKKRKKGKQDMLGQSKPTVVAKDSNRNDPIDAGREPEDQQKLKKKKKKTKKDKWGQPISSAADEHGDVSPKAVRRPSKLNQRIERQVAKAYQYEPNKVVVSGMPYSATEEEIHDLFKDVGPIVQMKLSRFPDSGNFRGLAFITFQSEGITNKALELDGTKMADRFVKVERCRQDPQKMSKVEFPQEPQKVEGCYSVYVGNLSWEVTEEEIREFFCDTKIEAIRLATNKKTGQFRGFCHVDFADDQSLELAISKNQAELHGRQVKVSYAVRNRE